MAIETKAKRKVNRKPWTPNLNFDLMDFHDRIRRRHEEYRERVWQEEGEYVPQRYFCLFPGERKPVLFC